MTTSAVNPTHDILHAQHVWTPAQLAQRTVELRLADYIVDGLFPQQALSIVVGDSGLGKSPLLYQAAISVAAGLPFLGRRVQQGRVLYLDYENGLAQVASLVSRIAGFLKLPEPSANLRLWNANDSAGNFELAKVCTEWQPTWVIIDPLSAMYPGIERDNPTASSAFQELRKLMSALGCSVTVMHHLRKPSSDPRAKPEPLETAEWNSWFQQARGPRALINGSDMRLGVDRPSPCLNDDQLIVRGFERVNGDIPVIRICRAFDKDGEPVGYRLLAGTDHLTNPAHRSAYEQLPKQFTFAQAKQTYGRHDQSTDDLLKKCIAAGILRKVKKGLYEKITSPIGGIEKGENLC